MLPFNKHNSLSNYFEIYSEIDPKIELLANGAKDCIED